MNKARTAATGPAGANKESGEMEGPSIRIFPRTALDNPVELRLNGEVVRLEEAPCNLSAGGVFVVGEPLPIGASVQVRIGTTDAFEAEGIVRFCGANGNVGVGIEFSRLGDSERQHLDRLIQDLTLRGMPAA